MKKNCELKTFLVYTRKLINIEFII